MGGNVGSFTGTLNLDISGVKGSLAQLQSILGRLDLTGGVQAKFTQSFKEIDKAIKAYEGSLKKDFSKPMNISNIQGNFNALQGLLASLEKDINKISGKEIRLQLSPADKAAMEIATRGLQNLNKLQEEYNKIVAQRAALADSFGKVSGAKGNAGASFVEKQLEQGKKLNEILIEVKTQQRNIAENSKADITGRLGTSLVGGMDLKTLESQKAALQDVISLLAQAKQNKDGTAFIPDRAIQAGLTSLTDVKVKLAEARKMLNQLNSTTGETYGGQAETFKKAGEFIAQYEAQLKAAETATTNLFKGAGISGMSEMQSKIDGFVASLQKITTLDPAQLTKIKSELEGVFTEINNGSAAVEENIGKQVELSAKQQKIVDQYDMIASRIKYTFSLVNGLYIFQRTIRSAFNSVKELDASMNEIAVVTDKTTENLWDQIDGYNRLATAMGATVKGGYDVAKLYYQQGKSQEEVDILTKETLKLSRISGIEYAQATDFMTAALNGFKLEVKDAGRVSDIYSNLAAKAAVDTQEIAYAMTKTASIANNAGMSIENVAAMLTQMMETTREAPENIGTAMKTIIARFAEMKTLVGTTFTDDEGEIVNVNRVEGALRAAGVKLRDAMTGEIRPVDQVFLELASKWDGLTKNTQRYIATIAAGARQQSRFIALMDNYKRTVELVDIAQNSSGASDKQFAKTLDSLESKMNKLKNAWVEFTTGIADAKLIKVAVDVLTGLLNVVNDLTDGPAGGLSKLLLLFGGFKLAGAVVSRAVDGIKNTLVKQATRQMYTAGSSLGSEVTKGMSAGMNRTVGQSIRSAITAKQLNKELTQVFAKNRSAINFSDIAQVLAKGNKANLKAMAPELEDFTKALTGDFESGLKKLPEIAGTKGREAIEKFNEAVAEGDFEKASRAYADFYEKTLPALQEEARKENKRILAQNPEWSLYGKDKSQLFNTKTQKVMDGSGLSGPKQEAYIKYMANQEFAQKAITQPKVSPQTVTALSTSFNNVADAAGASGIAISQVAALLGKAGLGQATGILNGIANALMVVGSVAAAVGSIITVSWGAALVPILAVIAAVAAIGTIAVIAKNNSPEAKLAEAREGAQMAATAAEDAANAYDNLVTTIEDNKAAVASIGELTSGTVEFKQAVLDANSAIVDLVKKYPRLNTAGNITTDKNGLMQFTDAGEEAFKEVAYNEQVRTQIAGYAAEINQNKAQEAVDWKTFVKDTTGVKGGIITGGKKRADETMQGLLDYMDATNMSAQLPGFWESPQVQSILNKYYGDTGNEAATGVKNKIMESGAILDSYRSKTNAQTQQNQFLYGQIGDAYLASADEAFSGSAFKNIANNALKQTFDNPITADFLRYTNENIEGSGKYSRANARIAAGNKGSYKNNLLALYAEANKDSGYTYKDGKVYGADGSELDINGKDKNFILQQLANYDAAKPYTDQLEKLITNLESSPQKDKFAKLATDAGKLNNQDYKDMGDALKNMEDGEAKKALQTEFDAQLKARVKSGGELISAVQAIGASDSQLNKLQAQLGDMTQEQMDSVTGALTSINTNFGQTAAKAVYDQINSLSSADLADYSATLSKIDYTNSITSLTSIDKLIKSAGESQRGMLIDLRDSLVANTSQAKMFNDLYSSEDFTDIQTKLTDLYRTNDEITGDNIRELAQESSTLNDYLNQSSVSAETLATVFTHMEIGDIGIDNITSSLLAAVGAANQLETALGKSYDFIANNKWARSESELSKYITDASQTLLDLFSQGRIGDSQTWDIYKTIFGDKKSADIQKEIKDITDTATTGAEAQQRIQEVLNETGTVLTEVAKAGNLKPLWEFFNKTADPEVLGGIKSFNAELTAEGINFTEISGTTPEVIKDLTDLYGISEEMAGILLGDAISTTPGLREMLESNDLNDMSAAWISSIQNSGFLMQSEADALKALYPSMSASIDASINSLKKQGIAILDLEAGWAAEQSTGYQKLKDAFAKQEGATGPATSIKTYMQHQQGLFNTNKTLQYRSAEKSPIPEGTYADYDKLIDKFQELGATEAQAKGLADEYVKDTENGVTGLSKTIQKYTKDGWGEVVITGANVGEIDEKVQQAGVESLANAMAGAFSDITVKVAYEGEQADFFSGIAQAIASMQDKSVTVTTTYEAIDNDPYNAAGTGILGSSINTRSNVAERGMELITSKHGAYLAGLNGPEKVFLNRGDVVYNAAMTRQILAGKKQLKGFAFGKKNDRYSGPALLAEKGYELVQTKTGAYLAGAQGPTIANLNPEDVVYTHEETKKIMSGMPRYENGRDSSWGYLGGFTFGGASNVSGGSGSAADSKKFENDLDKQYNLLQIIEDILRRQEKLQDQLVNDAKISATEVAKNLAKQTELMQDDLESSQELLKRRKDEVADFLKENEKYKDFGSYDVESGLITIDWDKINKDGSKEVLEYIDELEKLQDNVQDAEDKVDEANEKLAEIAEQGRDTYTELQSRLYDAIADREQGIIDGLSENNDAITNSNSALLNSLQRQVDSDRQARDNSNTEADIAAKERRLALLQRDTSGSYALEIKQLQDEIKSAKEDYTDTLVDQAIQQLQESYDLAAEARGREIEMLQNQKDWREENGYYWNEVLSLMSGSAYGNETDQAAIDQIMALLGSVDSEYFGGSEEQKQQYIEELTSQFSEALGWYWNEAENKLVESRTENIKNDDGTITTNVYQRTTYYDPDGSVSNTEEKLVSSDTSRPITIDDPVPDTKPQPSPKNKGTVYSYTGKDGKTYTTPYASVALQNTKDQTGYTGGQVQKGLADLLKKGNITKVPAFKKGGLADYTGPAWLDGTKSKPELVLDSGDTANFMHIVDTAKDMKDGTIGQNNITQIQVDFNVDKIDNDTDFDALAEKVEKAIIKKAGYRNVTILSKNR